jgi:acetoin utilization deacetylase AcuC-like enzyme
MDFGQIESIFYSKNSLSYEKKIQKSDLLEKCTKLDSRSATVEELSILHTPEYIEEIRKSENLSVDEQESLCSNYEDIYLNSSSWEAALLSVSTFENSKTINVYRLGAPSI